MSVRKSSVPSGMFTDPRMPPVRWSIWEGRPNPSATTRSSRSDSTASSSASSSSACEPGGRRRLAMAFDGARAVDEPGEDLRPAQVDADHATVHGAGNLTRRMPGEEKPYRVYRGGRQKGKVPLQTRPARGSARARRKDGSDYRGPGPVKQRRKWSRGRKIGIVLGAIVLLLVVWAAASYLSLRGGIKDANKRLPVRRRRGTGQSELAAPLDADGHPAARHRSRESAGARGAALRLDHADPHRPVTPSRRVPVDSA